jgi:hypothetical protein
MLLHPSTEIISKGKAVVLDHTVDAILVRNLYGQEIVWGLFGCSRGKFKGFLANNANTENVIYEGL